MFAQCTIHETVLRIKASSPLHHSASPHHFRGGKEHNINKKVLKITPTKNYRRSEGNWKVGRMTAAVSTFPFVDSLLFFLLTENYDA